MYMSPGKKNYERHQKEEKKSQQLRYLIWLNLEYNMSRANECTYVLTQNSF